MTVLESWDGKPLEALLSDLRDLMEDTTFPTVARWREAGGRVVGHFQVYFPEEIAHAAGLLPLKIQGAPVEPRQAEARFGSYLCSIVKTSLELVLSGRVTLEMFVAPRFATPRATCRPSGDAISNIPARSSTCRRMPTPRAPWSICAMSMTGCAARSRRSPAAR